MVFLLQWIEGPERGGIQNSKKKSSKGTTIRTLPLSKKMDPKKAVQWPLQRETNANLTLLIVLNWAFLQTPTRAVMGLVVGAGSGRCGISGRGHWGS